MNKIIACLLTLFAASCNHTGHKQEEPGMGMEVAKDTAVTVLKKLDFAVRKDLVCGMPVSAGVTDTVSYKGKLYGFCAVECKEDFLKDPEQYLTTKK